MISDREYGFTHIINQKRYKLGVEIGVRGGTYSKLLLKYTNLQTLYSLDIELFESTKKELEPFGNRSIYRYGKSPDCSVEFSDNSLDFVYIDANHSFQPVYDDLMHWWPKVAPGGMMCGDDFTYVNNPSEGQYGVVEAVDQFCMLMGLHYGVTGAGNDTYEEKIRIARGYGKIIEKCLTGELKGINFGFSSDYDDIRIPQWYIFKL